MATEPLQRRGKPRKGKAGASHAKAARSESTSHSNAQDNSDAQALEQPPPTFARAAFRVSAWHVYALVGAVLLFWPVYVVTKQIEAHVDIPACEHTCESHGYTYESLVTGKSVYDCNCRGADGRHTYHDRAHIGGGTGAASAFLDWVLRTTAVLVAGGLWLVVVFGTPYWIGGSSNNVAARAYRALRSLFAPTATGRSKVNAPSRSSGRRGGARRGRPWKS